MENLFVEAIERDAAYAKYRRAFMKWANRMRRDAQFAQPYIHRNWLYRLFSPWQDTFSWTLTMEEKRRYAASGDPMRDYPDEMRRFMPDIWTIAPCSVIDGWYADLVDEWRASKNT